MKNHIQSFVVSILLNQLLPLVPLYFEFSSNGGVTEQSLTIVASMYAFAIGFSSKHLVLFGLSLLLGITQAGRYGIASGELVINFYSTVPFWIITIVFLTHVIERFDRHVRSREPYFLFETKSDVVKPKSKEGSL